MIKDHPILNKYSDHYKVLRLLDKLDKLDGYALLEGFLHDGRVIDTIIKVDESGGVDKKQLENVLNIWTYGVKGAVND